jgi:predicted nucleic acid-binding protein
MKVYLDTSSLVKLYHFEQGSDILDNFFTNNRISIVFLSEVAKIEFASAMWKKVRICELDEVTAIGMLNLFEADAQKYTFISVDSLIIEQAKVLLTKYGRSGLRTLDSIQLSTCLTIRETANYYFTADQLLQTLLRLEGFTV